VPARPHAIGMSRMVTEPTSVAPDGLERIASLSTKRDVADMLGVPWRTLAWVLYGRRPAHYYKRWTIKKRRGSGTRSIDAPRSTLYRLQKSLSSVLMEAYSPRGATHGFVQSRSIMTNAAPHVGRRFVLNVDIKDFFPSIHIGRVRGLFMSDPFNCPDEVATVLAQICCLDGRPPIGAPTSPVVSNMICRRLDRQLSDLARRRGCRYSRYADDLTFSTNRTSFPTALAEVDESNVVTLGAELTRMVEANWFFINPGKTRLQSVHDRQVVTGIKVNMRPNVDRRYIRRIRAMLHAWNRHGLDAAQSHVPLWDTKDRYPGSAPEFLDVLQGRIAFLAMVRGADDRLARRFRDQYDNLRAGRDINHGIAYESDAPTGEQLPQTSGRRQLLTVMFTDIVDSTLQTSRVGDAKWSAVRQAHSRITNSQVRRHRGHVVKDLGDGFMCTLDSPTGAVRCGRAIVEAVRPLGIEVRVGLHTGEVRPEDGDYVGMGVDIAARVANKARPSEVLVSRTLKDLVTGADVSFTYRGRFKLKGVPEMWSLYAASHAG
jgi:RNA-directed DNA polymerase